VFLTGKQAFFTDLFGVDLHILEVFAQYSPLMLMIPILFENVFSGKQSVVRAQLPEI
jgi:hypothetical protein